MDALAGQRDVAGVVQGLEGDQQVQVYGGKIHAVNITNTEYRFQQFGRPGIG